MEALEKDGHKALVEQIFKKIQFLLSEKVDNIDGKGLSSNDYTDEDAATVRRLTPPTFYIDADTMELVQNVGSGYSFQLNTNMELLVKGE